MPTSGPGGLAPYGAEGILAARIAVGDARSQSTHSVPELREQDSRSTPTDANAAAAELLAPPQPAQVLVGEINSENTAAMISQASRGGVPIIAPTASMISLTAMSDRVFRVWPSDAYEARQMATYIRRSGVASVGVLYLHVPYGDQMAAAFDTAFRAAGGATSMEEYAKGATDLRPLLQRLRSADALYVISYVEDAALILKQAAEMARITGKRFLIFGTSVLDSPTLVQKAGSAAEGLTFAVVQAGAGSDTTTRRRFIAAYRAARSAASADRVLKEAAESPTFAAFHVYDATMVALQACDAAAAEGNPSGNAIALQLHGRKEFSGLTGTIRFDTRGDLAADRQVVFKTVRSGAIVEAPAR